MTSAWQKYKEKLGTTRPWDIINPNIPKVTDEVASARMSICMDCPELIKATKQCKQCGCFMNAKTKLEQSACPIGKW
ncbi:MAG: hypothetical protein EBR82_11920 [Caulobacteraceae bacterium]|nr:hypothetical protein [Caulobacteraceae bacterium]